MRSRRQPSVRCPLAGSASTNGDGGPSAAPHHTASGTALVGGGSHPRPGEISLAHNGVLFLDELPEFDRHVLEVLREPLESGHIVISRAARQAEFPARFQLVAAMNPCPCGHFGDRAGPLPLYAGAHRKLSRARIGPAARSHRPACRSRARRPIRAGRRDRRPNASATVARRVAAARDRQLERQGKANARLDNTEVTTLGGADELALALLGRAMKQLALSARAFHRVLRVARTIADLAGSTATRTEHVAEAISLRSLDRRATYSPNDSISS